MGHKDQVEKCITVMEEEDIFLKVWRHLGHKIHLTYNQLITT